MRKLLFISFIVCASTLVSSAQSIAELRHLFEQEKFQEIIDAVSNPSSAATFFVVADAHHKLGEFEVAMECYMHAETLGEQSPSFHLNRGICAFSLGEFSLARRDLLVVKAQQNEPRVPYYFAAMAYLEGDYKGAVTLAKDAIELNPNYMEAHYLLGAILLEQKKYLSAENAFIKCIELRPEFAQSKVNLALCYIEQFKFEEAITLLTSLIETIDDFADAYYQRGVCFFQMHDTMAACEDWTAAAELGDEDAQTHVSDICEGNQRKIRRRKEVRMSF